MEKELTQNQGKWIWKRPGAYKVLSLTKEGKSIPEIAKEVKWKEETVWNFVCSPIFLRKLDTYLKSVFLDHQIDRILGLREVFKLYLDIIVGRKTVEGITPAAASRHLIKLLKIQEEPKISNPVNIISNISKPSGPEESKDLAEEFGFKDLEIPAKEGPESYSELNK